MPVCSCASLEHRPPLRQHRADAARGSPLASTRWNARVSRHVAFGQPRDRPVALRRGEEAVELVAAARGNRGGTTHAISRLAPTREGDVVVEVDVARDGRGERADDRVADRRRRTTCGDQARRRRQIQRRGSARPDAPPPAPRPPASSARALEIGDGFAVEIAPARRLEAVAVVDQHRLDAVVAGVQSTFGGPHRLRARRRRRRGDGGRRGARTPGRAGSRGRNNPPAPMCACRARRRRSARPSSRR